MALTRKFLATMGIDSDKIDEIISAHSETVTALKEQRDSYKADAEKLPVVQQELDTIKGERDKFEPFEQKYNDLKTEYDNYKQAQQDKELTTRKRDAYKALLKKAGIADKRIDSILRVTDLKDIKIDDNGAIEGADTLEEGIKSEWSEFISKTTKRGADNPTPPGDDGNGGGTTRAAELAKRYHENLYGKVEEG